MHRNQILLGALFIFSQSISCEKKATFDQSLFLENYAYNIILPSIDRLIKASGHMQNAVVALNENRNAESLIEAQQAWDKTYSAWIKISLLNFGPGGSEGRRRILSEEVALWPVSVNGIEEKIKSEDPELNDSKRNTRGLLAIEYLLFNEDSDDLLKSPQLDNRLNYLVKIVEKLGAQISQFNKDWQENYLTTFIENYGTAVKSSTTLMFNEMVRGFEAIRDIKLGIPMGLIAGQSGPQPELAEARFSRKSLEYLLTSYTNIVSFWEGKNDNEEDGIGWEEYLQSVEGGGELVKKIHEKFTKIDSIIERIPVGQNLDELAMSNNTELIELYTELQELTRYFKGESSSLLSLAITFSSGDGD
ncbi:MAG: imelysin family protein [Bacteroidota bacterium]